MKKILSNQAVKKFMHNRKAVLGLIIVCFLVLAVILIPIFMKLDPYTTDRAVGFNKPHVPVTLWARMMWEEICSQGFYMEEESHCLSESCLRSFQF